MSSNSETVVTPKRKDIRQAVVNGIIDSAIQLGVITNRQVNSLKGRLMNETNFSLELLANIHKVLSKQASHPFGDK